MKLKFIACGLCCLLTSMAAHASILLITGTPADDLLATPSSASPNLGGTKINFDALTPGSPFSTPFTSQGVTISSPDGLQVIPFSTQTGPNELFDNSALGSANLTITTTAQNAYAIGVGIADSDPVTILLQALGAGNSLLGTAFAVTIPENTVNPGNAYFVIEDTLPGLTGLQITESASNGNFSGLAIDDVQIATTPEPSNIVLMATGLLGLVMLTSFGMLKRA